MNTEQRRNILEMNNIDARDFLLKEESYFSLNLPEYFDLSNLIDSAREIMGNPEEKNYVDAYLLNYHIEGYQKKDNLNYMIYISKDGLYSWRPQTIINPFLYIDLVNFITSNADENQDTDNGWQFIQKRFREFQENERIYCASIPKESLTDKTDTGANILGWWEKFEQKTIEKSLDFNYSLFTDISNFYPSIYTHSIPWALYGKNEVKNNRKKYNNSFGQKIDTKIQKSQYNQTNGIHQGSVLMDFISEIILGYIDLELSELLEANRINDYYILRYRDDYRILSNDETTIDLISKYLQQVLLTFNLNLGSAKTYLTDNIISDAIKKDKRYWEPYRTTIRNSYLSFDEEYACGKITLQKHLYQIHELAKEHPNSGMVKKALTEFYEDRIFHMKELPKDYKVLISILVDIMYNNPNTISYCIIIIAKILEHSSNDIGRDIVTKILKKYKYKANTDYIEIWLQRLSIMFYEDESLELSELGNSKIYNKVLDSSINIFPNNWINSNYRDNYIEPSIIDEEMFEKMRIHVTDNEINELIRTDNEISG